MAKAKSSSVPNKSLHSRVSYLYQIATYLAAQEQQPQHPKQNPEMDRSLEMETSSPIPSSEIYRTASRRMASDLRSVSQKVQIRMSPRMKNTICKNCNTVLIIASTCSEEVENKSKGGKKPWADVLVQKCNTCGMEKRFPVEAQRQKRRPHRPSQSNPQP